MSGASIGQGSGTLLPIAARVNGDGNWVQQIEGDGAVPLASQATLADVLAKIIAAPATEASSSAMLTQLGAILTALGNPAQAGGNVAVSNFPATQAVTGPLTDAQLRATAVPVSLSGNSTSANQTAAQTLTGAVTETAPASDTASSGLNGRLQRIAQRITSLIAQLPASLGIKTAAASLSVAPASDASFRTVAQQSLDAGNSAAWTNTAGTFTGAWMQTRSLGIVRQLVVLASNVSSGLGGTFVFEYGEDGSTATISESRPITDFATVRDFDLINAGEWFRVKFTPSRTLTAAEFVFINTVQRRQNDGAFVRLANQEIEEANAAMGQTFSYQKAFDPNTGKSVNIRPGATVAIASSVTPLGIAASFNAAGTYFSLDNISGVAISVTTDQSGTLFIDNATDSAGSNVVRTSSFSVTGGVAFFIGLSTLTRYMRVRYTNGATAQTTFTVQTNTKVSPLSPTLQRSDTQLSDASILLNTKAVISGRSPSGSYLNVPVNKVGNLIGADFLTEVAKGNVPSHALVNRVGYNPDIDAAASETIWQAGGVYLFPAAAGVISSSSSNAGDTAAGAGARTILIEGLNSSYVEISETVTLMGVVPVATVAQFLRVLRVSVVTSGTGLANLGTITSTITAIAVSGIAALNNRSALGIYTVPAGKTAYMLDLNISQSNNSASSISAVLWGTEGQSTIFRRRDSYGGHSQSGGTARIYRAPLVFQEKSDIRVDAITGGNNNEVHLLFNILLVDN